MLPLADHECKELKVEVTAVSFGRLSRALCALSLFPVLQRQHSRSQTHLLLHGRTHLESGLLFLLCQTNAKRTHIPFNHKVYAFRWLLLLNPPKPSPPPLSVGLPPSLSPPPPSLPPSRSLRFPCTSVARTLRCAPKSDYACEADEVSCTHLSLLDSAAAASVPVFISFPRVTVSCKRSDEIAVPYRSREV